MHCANASSLNEKKSKLKGEKKMQYLILHKRTTSVFSRAFHRFSFDENSLSCVHSVLKTLFNVDQCHTLAFGRYSITRVKRTSSYWLALKNHCYIENAIKINVIIFCWIFFFSLSLSRRFSS